MKTNPSTPKISPRRIAPAEVQPENTLLLDVRTPAEFETAHIDGAVLHPLTELSPEEVKKLADGKTACIVICQSGTRAKQAAEKLAQANLPNLQILEGGVQAWEAAGRPLNRGTGTISLERQVRIVAGTLVFTGAALGYFVHPAWIVLSGFVGAGLVFAGLTDTCGMGLLLAKMPWNNHRGTSVTTSCCSRT
ncbi:MAG: rhodanese-like domain-containing protein [Chthoniobacterales bacterium]